MFGLTLLTGAWGFITSPLGKLLGVIFGLVLLVLSGAFVYHSWAEGIRETERVKAENTALKTAVADRDKTIKQLKDIAEIQAAISQNQSQDNSEITRKSGDVSGWIGTQAGTKSDRESSQILKDTFERLYER